jgi:glycosyltransferase involved in cell wall biosynthesis
VFDYNVWSFRHPKALAAQVRLARDIRRHGIQIVHSYNFYANVFAIPAAKLAGARVVASIRDMGVYLSASQRRVQRYICKLADQILVNANAIKDWLVEDGYEADRIAVIPNGIDLARFAQPAQTGSLHREFRLPDNAPLIGVLTRVKPLKGIDDFLRAAAIIAIRFPTARFLVVGDGLVAQGGTSTSSVAIGKDDYWQELTRLVEQLGLGDRVIFTGYRADVERVLPELTVSVQPSLSEALSNVVLESMAAGVPVVATRVGGTTEAVQDGQNGLLVPPGDPAALADAVCRLLDAPALASRLGQAGRRSVERFSMSRMVESTSLLYQALLERDGRFASTVSPTRRELQRGD